MKVEPKPSDHEVLAGLVERVTYHNGENGFCVLRAKARGHRDVVTVVGHAATISAGAAALHFPRVPSLEAFGRRPRCQPNHRERPSSETLTH